MSYFPILIETVRDKQLAIITHPDKLHAYESFRVLRTRVSLKVD